MRGRPEKGLLKIRPIEGPAQIAVAEPQKAKPFFVSKSDIGVVKERPEVIEGIAHPHPLEVDQRRFPADDHHVFRLQVPMNETAVPALEAPRERRQFPLQALRLTGIQPYAAEALHKVFPEVIPLPPVERRAEGLRQGNGLRGKGLQGKRVELKN